MKKIFGILFVFSMILYSCGCANKSSTMTQQDTKQPQSIEYKVKAKPPTSGIKVEKVEGVMKDGKNKTTDIQLDVQSDTIHQITQMTGTVLTSPLSIIKTANGTLVYNIDSVFTVGVVSRVEARIIKKVGQQTTEQLVSLTTHTTTGVIRTEVIPVGDIMDMDLASLEGGVFDINKISSGDQPIDANTVTEWIWGVTALKTGNHNLILKAKVKGVSRDMIVFDKQINVENKPKKMYSTKFEIPKELVRYEENTIKVSLTEKNIELANIEWGGNGKIEIEFTNLKFADDVIITKDGDYSISDDKSLFNYKWSVQPKADQDSLHCVIKIVGDYEELVIYDKYIRVNENIKGTFQKFLDGAAKSWYWVFTSLIVPIYLWVKKKYFPEKKIFRRKRKTVPKP